MVSLHLWLRDKLRLLGLYVWLRCRSISTGVLWISSNVRYPGCTREFFQKHMHLFWLKLFSFHIACSRWYHVKISHIAKTPVDIVLTAVFCQNYFVLNGLIMRIGQGKDILILWFLQTTCIQKLNFPVYSFLRFHQIPVFFQNWKLMFRCSVYSSSDLWNRCRLGGLHVKQWSSEMLLFRQQPIAKLALF